MSIAYKSSIIDLPRKKEEVDLFGIQKYQDALVEFIQHSETPITIALQGEWGSGKTSLMKMNCATKENFTAFGLIPGNIH